ncbi:MAG: hypothetical protein KatS3mg115_0462 [Candidatus Poribacteria bacterium]|nr:MAG: hypothetical protein KatS3mg115_0462 [Candidatus Poribacteria bacterium]
MSATPEAYYYRGLLRRTYKQIGDRLFLSSEIAEDFRRALALRPGDPDALYQLGLTYQDMEEDEQAERTFRELLAREPRYPGAHLALGQIAEAKQQYDSAIREYEAELKNDPDSAAAHFRLGFLYANAKGDPWLGAQHLEKAVALDPGPPGGPDRIRPG